MTNQSIKNAFARMRQHIIIALDEKVDKKEFNNTLNNYYLKEKADLLHDELHDYVDTEVAALVNAAPETLDTLGELAVAFEENQDMVQTLDASITNKADKTEMNLINDKVTALEERCAIDRLTLRDISTGELYVIAIDKGQLISCPLSESEDWPEWEWE